MINENTKQIFIGDAASMNANATSAGALTTQLNIVAENMTVITSPTITTSPNLYVVNKYANGDYKYSNPIAGMSVMSFKAESYVPASMDVWAIGYNRKTAAGLIEVNTDTDYEFSIKFKNDKLFFSERGEYLRGTFHSAVAATELSIATQIAGIINNSAFGSQPSGIKVVKALVVGNGTGLSGLTSATHYGVEIWGLEVNQFTNTSYSNKIVYFNVGVNDSLGFGSTTTCTQINAASYGTGTYEQVYNTERETSFNEGRLNARSFPIPSYTFLADSTGTLSGSLSGITCAGTATYDILTITTGSNLVPGSKIVVSGNTYVIKYFVTAGTDITAVLSTPLLTSPSGTAIAAYTWYDIFNIVVKDTVTTPGANIGAFAKKVIMIASPACNASGTDLTTQGTQSALVKSTLNTWMATTPLAAQIGTI